VEERPPCTRRPQCLTAIVAQSMGLSPLKHCIPPFLTGEYRVRIIPVSFLQFITLYSLLSVRDTWVTDRQPSRLV